MQCLILGSIKRRKTLESTYDPKSINFQQHWVTTASWLMCVIIAICWSWLWSHTNCGHLLSSTILIPIFPYFPTDMDRLYKHSFYLRTLKYDKLIKTIQTLPTPQKIVMDHCCNQRYSPKASVRWFIKKKVWFKFFLAWVQNTLLESYMYNNSLSIKERFFNTDNQGNCSHN